MCTLREAAPTIIFMDEIDSIGSTRAEGSQVRRSVSVAIVKDADLDDGGGFLSFRVVIARCKERCSSSSISWMVLSPHRTSR